MKKFLTFLFPLYFLNISQKQIEYEPLRGERILVGLRVGCFLSAIFAARTRGPAGAGYKEEASRMVGKMGRLASGGCVRGSWGGVRLSRKDISEVSSGECLTQLNKIGQGEEKGRGLQAVRNRLWVTMEREVTGAVNFLRPSR